MIACWVSSKVKRNKMGDLVITRPVGTELNSRCLVSPVPIFSFFAQPLLPADPASNLMKDSAH